MEEQDFAQWLSDELRQHGWSRAEFARLAGISAPQVTRILNREQNPGHDSIIAFSRVLKKTPELMYRLAGLLPPTKHTSNESAEILYDQIMNLPPELREQAIEYVDYLYYRRMRPKDGTSDPSTKP